MIDDVKVGSKWISSDYKEFVVLGIFENPQGTWVHYRSNNRENNSEYSCLIESFKLRFSQRVD
jgi:hypothetical protein